MKCPACGLELSWREYWKHSQLHGLKDIAKGAVQERRAISNPIVNAALALLSVSSIWAFFYWLLLPQMQSWQVSNYPNAYYAGPTNYMPVFNFILLIFMFVTVVGVALYLFNESQKKRGAEDIPG